MMADDWGYEFRAEIRAIKYVQIVHTGLLVLVLGKLVIGG